MPPARRCPCGCARAWRRPAAPLAVGRAIGRRTDVAQGSSDDEWLANDPEAAVDQLLDWLAANNYLSEARFVESRVNARSRKQGTLRIKLELSRHGLALEPEQAAALRETEFARAQALWQRKFGELAPDARAAGEAGAFPGGARVRGGRRAARGRRRGGVLTRAESLGRASSTRAADVPAARWVTRRRADMVRCTMIKSEVTPGFRASAPCGYPPGCSNPSQNPPLA